MKKRILSTLLCLVLVVGLLPVPHVHADYADGVNCEYCGEWIYDEWVCDYGDHCGIASDHSDCYEEHHCPGCNLCIDESDLICEVCGLCEYCVEICVSCISCAVCTGDGLICVSCGLCTDCGGEVCWNCSKCIDCVETNAICDYCGLCYDDSCGGMCSEGIDHLCRYDHDGYACTSCGKCRLTQDGEDIDLPACNNCGKCIECLEPCSYWDADDHDLCLECHDDFDYCPDCNHCYLGDMIAMIDGSRHGCAECERCLNCVDWICEECARCADCVEQCDHCERKCLTCHKIEGRACVSCGMCFEGYGHCIRCGICYECGSACSDCGLCLDCYAEVHCPSCDACATKTELCEGCSFCPDCTDYCDDCKKCAHCEEDTHCSVCYVHSEPDLLCAGCGACGDCVELCLECGLCMDCADEADHCADCGECGASTIICGDCGLCESCAVSADQHCGNYCGSCYENVLYCEICNECVECLGEENYCLDCFQCKSHHTDGVCDGRGSHTHKPGDWVADASQHWKECRLCKTVQSKASHALDADMVCTICGYDTKVPITITRQPKDARTSVSDRDADYGDPLYQNNNNVSFKVAAKITDKSVKGTLSYQWYYKYEAGTEVRPVEDLDRSEDGYGVITGAKTQTLTTSVETEACIYPVQYFCRITLTSSDGTVLSTADSNMVTLKAAHVYNRCKPVNSAYYYTLYLPNGGSRSVYSDDGGHKDFCCGEGDEERANPLQKIVPHNYGTPVIITAALYETGPFEAYYQYTCLDCGAMSYMKKHVHQFDVPIDYTDPEAMAFLEANCTDQAHPLRCTVEGCSAFIYEQHEYLPTVYAHPDATSAGQYMLQCRKCEYTLSGSDLLAVNNGAQWTPDITLVSATNAAVRVDNNTRPTRETKSRCLVDTNDEDFVVLIPQQRDGYKVVDWTCEYTDYLAQEDGTSRAASGKYKTIQITNRRCEKDREIDGFWWADVPTPEEYVSDYGVHGGGWMKFTPIYETCTHENGTKLGNTVDAVCIYSGYTGDTVCVDCGEVIGGVDGVGNFTPAPSTEHTGELVLIADTVVAGSCTRRGYTGDSRCSDCGRTVPGKSTSYIHNKVTTGYVAPTCTAEGYTGDTICSSCGKHLGSGQSIPALDHSWNDGVISSGTLTSITYTCTRCGETCSYVDRNAGLSSGVIDNVVIQSIKLNMSGYTIGNTLKDVQITPTRSQSSLYTVTSAYFFRAADMPNGTDMALDLRKMAASSYEIQSGEEFYLVVPLRTQNKNTFANKIVAKLDGSLRGEFVKDATIKAEVPAFNGHGTEVVSVTASVAVFKLPSPAERAYAVKMSGSVAENSGAGRYMAGETVTIHAGNKPGYTFVGWTGSDNVAFANAGSASTTFTMPAADVVVIAIWKGEIKMPVTDVRFTLDSGYAVGAAISDLQVSGKNIGVQEIGGSTGLGYGNGYRITTNVEGTTAATGTFAADTTYYLAVHLVATEGYRLSNTTKEDIKLDGKTAEWYVEYPKTGDAIAVFRLNKLTQPASNARLVTVQTDGFGEAAASLSAAAPGTVITLTARANSGYRFKRWQVVSGTVTIADASSEVTTFTMPSGNVTVKAIFEPDGFVAGGYARYSADTGTVTLETLPAHTAYYLIAAYQGGQFVCFTVGTWPDNQLPAEARQADELRVFYLNNESAPVAPHDILQIK